MDVDVPRSAISELPERTTT